MLANHGCRNRDTPTPHGSEARRRHRHRSLGAGAIRDGDVFFDETRLDLTCNRRVGQEKFEVDYKIENCAGSVAPSRSSKGEVTVTATTEDGELVVSRTLKCNK